MDQETTTLINLVENHGFPAGLLIVIIFFCWKILPRVLNKGIELVAEAMNKQAEAIERLADKAERASTYNREEHAKIIKCLDILVDKVLLNGNHEEKKE